MLSILALLCNVLLMTWLFVKDGKERPMPSRASWIALTWIMLIGSRYISGWFGVNVEVESPDELVEGSPLDRLAFVALIASAAIALLIRKPAWTRIYNRNHWYFFFFIYCGISIFWSDYPFVSFKRYIKEFGNVMMALLILTERDPVEAFRAILSRYAHLVIPLSILLIYSIPSLGTYYDDSMTLSYCGVATNKNKLGVITFVCSIFLIWDAIHYRALLSPRTEWTNWVLLMMAAWIVYIAHSATALVCIVIGTLLLIVMKLPFGGKQLSYMAVSSVAAAAAIMWGILFHPEAIGVVAEGVGRDSTFTGRTELWIDLLQERVNPLVGTGYQSFWLGERAESLWEKYVFHPTQAHNGYLETYLNGGVFGVGLLIAMMVATGRKLRGVIEVERNFGILLVAFIITAVLYNCTEAMISRLSLLWFVVTIAALYAPLHEGFMYRDGGKEPT